MPIIYATSSSPYYETLWKPNLKISQPILSCEEEVSGGAKGNSTFKVYLELKGKGGSDIGRRIAFKILGGSNSKKIVWEEGAAGEEIWNTWQLKFNNSNTFNEKVTLQYTRGSSGYVSWKNSTCQGSQIELSNHKSEQDVNVQ